MDVGRYNKWQTELVEKISSSTIFISNSLSMDSILVDGFVVRDNAGRLLKIGEEVYIKYFKNSGTKSFSWEDSISFATNTCEKHIKTWVDFYKG